MGRMHSGWELSWSLAQSRRSSGEAKMPWGRLSERSDRLRGSARMVDGSDGERRRDDP